HTPRTRDDLPPLTGGLVGYLGWDAVRRMERLPDLTTDDLHLPELQFMLATDLAVLDHADGSILLIANVVRRLTPHAEDDPVRASNPSPYMYLLRFGDLDVVGSSPEAHVKVSDRRAMLHPIAGTKPRGATPEEDAAIAVELLADPKERAEHVMLVDLGRNDLGRVCAPGSVEVVELMSIERYSHVMHIVSTVIGTLTDDH